jgi:hypothetical protein
MCECHEGYSGISCQTTCNGICQGDYPYGCASEIGNEIKRYGCHPQGGCNYLGVGEEYPYSGFCTFKGGDDPPQQPIPTSNPTAAPTAIPTPSAPVPPSCDGICQGDYPYGCAQSLIGVERYGCHPQGGCNYLGVGEEYPYSGFCTFKHSTRRYLRSNINV